MTDTVLHVPAIVHRSGGVPASERNVCMLCGQVIVRQWDITTGEWVSEESNSVICVPEIPK